MKISGRASAPRVFQPRRSGKAAVRVLAALATLMICFLVLNPIVVVGAGQRAVLFDLRRGTLPGQLDEGMHLVLPFVQSAVFYDVRTQTYTMSAVGAEGEIKGDDSLSALTSDGQVVTLDVSVRFHPDATRIYQLHQQIGPDYANKIIRPAARSQARVTIAQFPVSDVYAARREMIEKRIEDALRKSLGANDIVLDEVLLRDVQFSPAYAAAIEQKQIAQQNDQRMQYVLLKAQKEKQQKILEAQGDAASIELRGRAIAQNARVVQYEYARKVAPNVSAIITDGRNVNVPFSAPQAVKR
jgi:prohibitin 2